MTNQTKVITNKQLGNIVMDSERFAHCASLEDALDEVAPATSTHKSLFQALAKAEQRRPHWPVQYLLPVGPLMRLFDRLDMDVDLRTREDKGFRAGELDGPVRIGGVWYECVPRGHADGIANGAPFGTATRATGN